MVSVSPHSFRHILLVRILLLLMPILGISEWLLLHQARLILLDNAQQQAQEIARSQAVTLELHQRALMDSSDSAPCIPSSALSVAASSSPGCNPQDIIERSFDNLLSQPILSSDDASSTPVVALFSPQGELLGHSHPTSIGKQLQTCPDDPAIAPTCELIQQFSSQTILPTQPFSDRQHQPELQLILNDQWLISSHSVRITPAPTAQDGAMPAEPAPDLGQLVVALPTGPILAPLKSLSHWMIGATFGLLGVSIALALYLSRELAHPVEQLRDRLLVIQRQLATANLAPPGGPKAQEAEEFLLQAPSHSPLKIHEFQQLSGAFNQLIDCLNQRSTALEKATQEAHNASQLKSDFIAATSHELRTPLNALIGHIQLIQDGYCDDAEEESTCLSQIHEAALHLLKVLNELLDIARIEAGKFEFKHQPFELGQLLEEVLEMERSHLIQKELTLKQCPQPDDSNARQYWVQADRDKLKQVILNVLSNAIKFTGQGSINIALQPLCELESLTPAPPEPTIVLSITDTGIGIDPRQHQKLFRPFARASQLGNQPYEGSGLGLAISRTLMERMGGSICLYSPGLGQGTTVELHLPLYPSPGSSSTHPKPPPSQETTAA